MSNQPSQNKADLRPATAAGTGKLPPRVVIPDAPAPPKRGPRLKGPLWLWLGLGALLLLCAGLPVFKMMRETSVLFKVDTGDLQAAEQPALIYNLMGKVDLLRSDYTRRLAPISAEQAEVQNLLAAARADLAGKLEAKRLLQNEEKRLEAEIPSIVAQNQSALNDLWGKQGSNLEREFANTKEEYQLKLDTRARELGVEYQRNKDIDSIDVSVNAFKLALYGAPKSVKVEDERKFAEGLLVEWQQYQEEWQKRLGTMREKSNEIRQRPASKIEEVKAQIEKVRDDLRAADVDISSYQLEVRQYETRQEGLVGQAGEVAKQFTSDLLSAPKDFIKTRLALDSNSMAELSNLDDRKQDYPPGEYLLWVAAKKDGEVFWALKKFTIREHRRETVNVLRRDFVLARSYLDGKKP